MSEDIEGLADTEVVDWAAAYAASISVRMFVDTLVELLLRRARRELCDCNSDHVAAKGKGGDEDDE